MLDAMPNAGATDGHSGDLMGFITQGLDFAERGAGIYNKIRGEPIAGEQVDDVAPPPKSRPKRAWSPSLDVSNPLVLIGGAAVAVLGLAFLLRR